MGFQETCGENVSFQKPSASAYALSMAPATCALPTWWRGWRLMMRLTGGGGQPLLQHPCQHHCESGARSLSSESVSAPPGPSGSQSGPSESLSASWGKGQETLGFDVLATFICRPISRAPQWCGFSSPLFQGLGPQRAQTPRFTKTPES